MQSFLKTEKKKKKRSSSVSYFRLCIKIQSENTLLPALRSLPPPAFPASAILFILGSGFVGQPGDVTV